MATLSNSQRLREARRKREEENKNSSSQSVSNGYRNSDKLHKKNLERSIGMDTFESDLNSLGTTISDAYNGWQTQETMLNTKKAIETMHKRLSDYQTYQSKFGGTDLSDVLDGYQAALDDWDGLTSMYGAYKDADSYTKERTKLSELYSMSKDELESKLGSDDPYAYTTIGGQDITWQSLYEDKFRKEIATSKEGVEGWKKYLADKEAKETDKPSAFQETVMKGFTTASDNPMNTILNSVLYDKRQDTTYREPTDDWTEQEQRVFGAFYLDSPEKAYEYAVEVNNRKASESKDAQKQSIKDSATSGFWAGAGHTGGALLTAPFGLADYLDDLTDIAVGRPIMEEGFVTPFEYSQAVTGGVSSHLNDKYGTLDESIPVIGGKGLGDVYGVGTSIAQSAMSAYTLGSLGTMVSYFGQGAASGVDDALSRGATDEQAMLYGTLVGAAEGISESIGVDNMFKLGSADTVKGFLKNILKQAGSEGIEEGISSVLSEFSDRLVMQDKSVYENAVRTYMSQGMSESEAKEQASKDVVNSVAWDVVAGALSGGVHGSVQTTVQSVKENKQAKNIGATIRGNHNVEDLGKLASDLNNDSYQDYIDLINSGNISDKNLGRLYRQMAEDTKSTVASEEKQSVMRAVANMANEMGDSKNSGLIASAIQKKANGEKLSSEEKAVLKTDTAKAIMAELDNNGLDIKISDSLSNAYDMRDRTASVLFESKSEQELAIKERAKELTKGEETKVGEEVAKIEGIRVENGTTTLLTSQGEVLADDAQLSSSDAEMVAIAETMDSEKANLFIAQRDESTDMNTYSKAFDLAFSYGESQLGVSYAIENIRNLNAAQVSAIYKAGRQKKVTERQKAINAIKNKYTAKKFYKGTVNDSAIDYTNSGKGEVNWSDLTDAQRENVDFLKALFTGLGANVRFTANGVEYDGLYDPEHNEIVIDVYAGTTPSNVKDLNLLMITTSAHELTHWMEVAAPVLFAKIKDHAFETLRMKDGKSDAVRIAEEKLRIESKHPEMIGKVTNEYAISEIVARSCEDMLSMTNVGKEALARLSDSERKTFLDKVKEIIQDMISYIDEILGRYKSRTKEAEILREYQDRLKEMAKMWEEAINEAIEVNQSIIEAALTDGISKDGTTIVGENMVQMSEKTYNDGGREYLEKWLKRKSSGKKATISKEDAADILRQTDEIYRIMQDIKENNELPDYARWAETNVTKDENGKTISVIVKNGDYAMNLDVALVCKKRTALNAVLNALVQSNDLSVYTLTETDVAELNAIIKEHEFEIACALCFVDSKRYRVGSWAESFCEGVHTEKDNKYGFNEMVRSLVPKGSDIKIDEFNFTNRDILNQPTENLLKNAKDSELDFTLIDQIMRDNPPAENGAKSAQYRYAEAIKNNKELRSILNPSEIISSIGLDAIRVEHTALYGLINGHQGTAKPKFAHQAVAFANDILRATSWNAERAKYVGGVRLQSFSDFMATMVFDYVQMVSELSAKKLTAHAYTKEPLFVKLFGMTGIKINMSLVPKVDLTPEQIARFKTMTDAQKDADPEYQRLKETAGLRINEKGEVEYIWEDETFPYDVAMDIMADSRYTKNCGTIAVGISSAHIRKLLADDRISMVIPYHKSGLNHMVAEMRNIALYNDYTSVQNTRYASGEKLDTKKDKDFNFYGDLYGTKTKPGTHDPKQTAENYKKWCEEKGFLPRFDEFKDDPNYYKLLIDFSVYDINDNMRYTEQEAVKAVYPSEAEFKDLIVNGVQKNGKTYGGLKQAQSESTRLDNETQQIVNEFRNRLLEKHGEDVLAAKQFADKDIQNDQIERNMTLIADMDSVCDIPSEKLVKTGKKPSELYTEYFNSLGNVINSEYYGKIDLKKSSVKSEIRHGITAEKLASMSAIPDVISYGKEIYNKQKEESDVRRIVICAPIKIGEEPYYMGVMLQKDSNGQRLYLHNVVIEKETNASSSVYSLTELDSEENNRSFMTNILQKAISVKKSMLLSRDIDKKQTETDADYSDLEIDSWLDYLDLDELFETLRTEADAQNKVKSTRRVDQVNKMLKQIGLEFNGTKQAAWTDERIEKYLSGSYYGSTNPDYAQAYITYMTPKQFLDLTMGGKTNTVDMIKKESASYGSVDFEKIGNSSPIFIEIKEGKNWSKVIGHEGRHRMYLLGKAGFEKIPVLVFDYSTKYDKTAKDEMKLIAQRYNDTDLISKARNTTIHDVIPFSQGNKELIKEKFGSGKEADIHYADKDTNDSRTLLANALETVVQNDDERDLLKEYRSNIDILNIKESELAEIRKQIKELTFGSGEKDAKKLAYLKKRAEKLRNSINYFDKKLLSLEANKHLKDVVDREKEKVRKKRNEYVKKSLSSQKERLAKKAEIESITKNALTLKKWLVANSKDKHVAEVMKPVVKSLFDAIDFSSKQLLGMTKGEKSGKPTQSDISLAQAISDVRDVIVNGGVDELQGFGMDEELEQLVKTANVYARTIGDNAYILNKMTLEELKTLDTFVKAIKKVVSDANEWYVANSKNGIVYESQRDMKHMKELGQAKTHGNKLVASVLKTLNWDNINPYNAFKRMGEGSKKIFSALQDGWDKFAFNVRKVIEYADKTYDADDVKRWNEEVHEIDILLPASAEEKRDPNFKGNHKTIRMTTAQMMSLYCLQKREQALGHMLQGGIGIADIKTKDGVIAQNGTVMLSESEIEHIVDILKQDEKAIKVADALQKFMVETCADWGNEISMRRFGYKAFGEENYFPIKADPRVLKNEKETKEREKSLYKLLNASFTKALTQNANNRILVEDIFDVFARHTTEMAKYNALALPVLDAVRWFNYTEKGQKMADGQYQTFSIRESMRDAFGDEAINYINTFLEDLNGSSNVGRDSLARGFFTNAKIASVAMNLKVAALQPTSYLRAAAVIDPKYLMKTSSPSDVKKGIELSKEWCGMVYWKSLGFYDTNIQRGVSEIIKNDKSFKDKFTEKSMLLAAKADEFTLGCLWNACEAEIKDTRKDLKVGDDAYYEAIGKRLRDVIYQTQVVDSTMTRSQMMRSPDGFDKVLTMFGSEPTLSYNMLADVFWDWKLDERKYGKTKAFENNRKKMVRVAVAYTMTNLVTSILETAFEAYRDDDDDEEEFMDYMKSFFQTFLSNQGITTKIPYVKDLISILQGFTSSRTDTQWIQNLTYAFKEWVKIFNGEGNVYKGVYRTLSLASQASGYAFSNAMRELASIWNATIGNIFPSLKLTK